MTVNVSQEHIENGKRGDPMECPVALALNEECPSFGGWCVGAVNISRWDQGNGPVCIPVPPAVNEFIRDFDACRPAKAFSFVLEVEVAAPS